MIQRGCSLSLGMLLQCTNQLKNCTYLNLLQVNAGCFEPCVIDVSAPRSVSLLSRSLATKPQSSVSMP
jgi:hypothetical protein